MASFIGRVEGGDLSLRASTSTNSQRYTYIDDDASVTVSTIPGNNEWFATSYNGYNGYVVAQYIAIENDGGTARVTTASGSLNIRKAPSGNYLYGAPKNSIVRLLDTTSVSGWYRVSTGQGTGWAQSQYLTILTNPDNENGGSGDNDEPSSDTPYCYGVTTGNGSVYLYKLVDNYAPDTYITIPSGITLPLWQVDFENTKFLTVYNGTNYHIYISSVDIIEENTNTLSQGSVGIGVVKYKNLLRKLGYHPNSYSNLFTGTMMAAVKLFQQKNGLTIDGIIGSSVRNKMNNNPIAWSNYDVTTFNNATINGYYPPMQWFMNDPYWSSFPWPANSNGTQTIGMDGNSITAMAMVLTTFFERAVTPVELAEYTIDKGYRDTSGNSGVTSLFYTAGVEFYDNQGIECIDHVTYLDIDELKDHLSDGCLIIASIQSSAYTGGTTQVVIYRIDNEKVYVRSPNKNKNPNPLTISEWEQGGWFINAYIYQRTNG